MDGTRAHKQQLLTLAGITRCFAFMYTHVIVFARCQCWKICNKMRMLVSSTYQHSWQRPKAQTAWMGQTQAHKQQLLTIGSGSASGSGRSHYHHEERSSRKDLHGSTVSDVIVWEDELWKWDGGWRDETKTSKGGWKDLINSIICTFLSM